MSKWDELIEKIEQIKETSRKKKLLQDVVDQILHGIFGTNQSLALLETTISNRGDTASLTLRDTNDVLLVFNFLVFNEFRKDEVFLDEDCVAVIRPGIPIDLNSALVVKPLLSALELHERNHAKLQGLTDILRKIAEQQTITHWLKKIDNLIPDQLKNHLSIKVYRIEHLSKKIIPSGTTAKLGITYKMEGDIEVLVWCAPKTQTQVELICTTGETCLVEENDLEAKLQKLFDQALTKLQEKIEAPSIF